MRSFTLILSLCLLPTMAFGQNGRWMSIGTHNSPPHVQTILAASGRILYFIGDKNVVYETMDGCENWSVLTGIPGSEKIDRFWVSPTGYLLGQSDTAFYWTRDGNYWSFVPHYDTLLRHTSVSYVTIDNNGTPYFAVDNRGVYRLNDDANAFTRIADQSRFYGVRDMQFDLANRLYLLGDSVFRFNAAFQVEKKWAHRADFGDKLYRVGNTMLVIGDSIRTLEPKLEAIADRPLGEVVVDSSGALLYLNGNRITSSTDFGRTWQDSGPFPVDYGDPLAATRAGLAVERPTATIAVSIDSEKSFTELQALNDRLTFLAIFVDRQGTIHAFDSLDGHWTSRDGGRYWSLMKQKRSYYVNPDVPPYAGIDGKIYMPTTRVVGTMNFHEVLVSSDNGATFHPMPHPSVAGAKNYNVYPTGTGELYSYSDTHTISHSTDDGTTWQDMMVLKDSTFPFLPTAPAQIVGFVKQGSLLWMASENSIYHTTDDGKFWVPTQGLTGQNFRWGSFTSLWGARSKSIIAPMQSAGKFWLSVNEKYSNDSYIWCYGPVVQVDDSDVIGYMTYRSSPFYEDELIRMHRGHDLFDTLDRGPDTLAIRGMAYDSSGNLLGIGYPSIYSHGSIAMRGIYKFYPTGSRVQQRTVPSNDLDVYVKDGRLEVSLASPQTIVELRIVNVLGELVAADHSILSVWTSSHLNPGLYIIQVRTQTSSMVRKIVIP